MKFEYMLLGRLMQDCEYFLNMGGRNNKHLWAGDVVSQINKMKELYNNLETKPEWLTMEQILEYEQKMIDK